MSIEINYDYITNLQSANAIHFTEKIIKPPPGSLSAPKVIPPLTIPPINTDIRFDILPDFKLSEHKGLSAIDIAIPEIFDWRHSYPTDSQEIIKKKKLITKPGNQLLCGSCWAISGAGIVADNFVISGFVDWLPNLSTTWSLACYPQMACQGGSPAQLFIDISKNGITSNHCIDYSWCSTNDKCNGNALKHFKASESVNLNEFLPTCGCYYGSDEHYLFKIDEDPKSIFIGSPGITEDNITSLIKKQVYTKGSVLGGFIVFNNFMKGEFSHVNGGVYLERGDYSNGNVTFSDTQTTGEMYKGSHAVAIIGWGIAKNILVDNGKKADVPYWYVRNSWGDKWADGGYFKMAMYPYNKISQFESRAVIRTPKGQISSGGIVFVTVSKPPVLQKLETAKLKNDTKAKPDSYYTSDPKELPENISSDDKDNANTIKGRKLIFKIVLIIIIILVIIILIFLFKKYSKNFTLPSMFKKSSTGRHGSYNFV
jgi:hypothetical protein